MLKKRSYFLWDKQTEIGHIGIKKVTEIIEDGIVIAKQLHRHVIDPTSNITKETDEIKRVANAVWTGEVIKAFEDKQKNIST